MTLNLKEPVMINCNFDPETCDELTRLIAIAISNHVHITDLGRVQNDWIQKLGVHWTDLKLMCH